MTQPHTNLMITAVRAITTPHCTSIHNKTDFYLVISSLGPEKLELGRNKPAATSLTVSVVNLSATIVMSAFGYSFCNAIDVLRPTTPAPITQTFIVNNFTSIER